MDLKLLSKNISSSIRNKIKYLLRINITSINNIFEVFDDVWEVESIFPHDRPYNYVLSKDREINAALKLATAPLQYIPDLEKDECKSFAYIQKLLILSGMLIYSNKTRKNRMSQAKRWLLCSAKIRQEQDAVLKKLPKN